MRLLYILAFCFIGQLQAQNLVKIVNPPNNSTMQDSLVSIQWSVLSVQNKSYTFRLQASTDSNFSSLYYNIFPITGTQINLPFLNNGTFFVRITGYEGTDSIRSSTVRFEAINIRTISSLIMLMASENAVTSAGVVTQILDQSSSNNHWNQTNTNLRPISVSDQLNNRAAIRFDGTNDYMTFTKAIDSIRSVFWVLRDRRASGFMPYYRFLLGGVTTFHFHRSDTNHLIDANAPNAVFNGAFRVNNTLINGKNTPIPKNQVCVLSLKCAAGYAAASNFSIDRLISNRVWDGDIYSLLIFKDTFTNAVTNRISTSLMDKYAPPVQLGPHVNSCASTYTISANKNYFKNWLWSTGDTTPTITVSNAGYYGVQTRDVFNRISTDTVYVYFDTTDFKPDLRADTFICKGQTYVLTAGPPNYKYLWQNGDTTNVIQAATTGKYIVRLTNCKNKTYFDTLDLFVSDKRPTLPDSAVYCHNAFVTLDPVVTGNISYSWSNGPTSKTINVNSVGQYIISVTDSLNCVFKDTTWVSIDSTLKNISLGPDLSLCNGNKISLTSSSPAITKYQWSTGDTVSFTTVKNTQNYAITVSNARNCNNADTVFVTIIGSAPSIFFDLKNRCESAVTDFIDLSVPPGGNTISSRKWKFTINDSSTLINAQFSYPTKGYKVVNFTVTTNVGCSADTTFTMYVYGRPKANFNTGVNCANSNLLFNNLTTFDPLDSASQWKWSFGDGGVDSIKTPLHSYDSSKLYNASLIVMSKNQCTDTIVKGLDIFPEIKLDIDFNSSCANDTTFFKANSLSKSIVSYSWDLTNGNTAVGKEVKFPFVQSGTYKIAVAVENAIGCRDTFYESIDVVAKPNITILSDKGCVNTKFIFKDSTVINAKDSIIDYLWVINNKDSLRGRTPTYYFKDSGSYLLLLKVKTKLGCENVAQKTVFIGYTPKAQFTYSPSMGEVPLWINFTNTSQNGIMFQWIVNSKDTLKDNNIKYYFEQYGNYIVSLNASNNFGCTNTISQEIKLYPTELDLLVEKLTTREIKDLDGKMTYELTLRVSNIGNRPIKSFDFIVSDASGTLWEENWTDVIEVGKSAMITLKSKPVYTSESDKSYLCVEAIHVNGTEKEKNTGNNSQCVNIIGGLVSKIYPVPVSTQLKLYISAAEEKNITMKIYNVKGLDLIFKESLKVQKGMNQYIINSSQWAKGMYITEITEGNNTSQIKFIVE